MVGFYKHDIPAWMNGTETLSDSAYRAYHVVVQLIMLNEGPITLNERGLSGRCNMTVKAFGRALAELTAAGKVTLKDGCIHNARADRELEAVMKNRENAGKGGKTRAIRAETQKNIPDETPNPLEINDTPQATLENLSSLKEKRREDSPIVPKGTDPPGFAEFWSAYPKRDGDNPRKPAVRAYAKVIRDGADPAAILKAVRAHAADLQAKGKAGTEFVPLATTWLNQGRFERFAQGAAVDGSSASADPAVISPRSRPTTGAGICGAGRRPAASGPWRRGPRPPTIRGRWSRPLSLPSSESSTRHDRTSRC